MENIKKIALIAAFFALFTLSFSTTTLLAAESQIKVYTGWNLIGLPLVPVTPYTAESLGQAINAQGGNCERIQYWDGSEWITHIIGTSFGDYNIEVGKGYFLLCNSKSIFTMTGASIASSAVSLHPGWNSISVPGPINAELAGIQINSNGGSCDTIIYWSGGGWEGHMMGMPFGDFVLTPGNGYFIHCSTASAWDVVQRDWITNILVSPDAFSPNGDNTQDTADISAQFTASCNWTISIRDSNGVVKRAFTGTGANISQAWDGKDTSNNSVSDGAYTYTIEAVDPATGSSIASVSGQIIIDNASPTGSITEPSSGQILSEVAAIRGTAEDLNFSIGHLYYGQGVSPTAWSLIGDVLSPVGPSAGLLVNWDTSGVSNGVYTIRLTVCDDAGNVRNIDLAVNLRNAVTTTINYSYDDLNRLENIAHDGVSTTYDYDEAGNIKNKTTE